MTSKEESVCTTSTVASGNTMSASSSSSAVAVVGTKEKTELLRRTEGPLGEEQEAMITSGHEGDVVTAEGDDEDRYRDLYLPPGRMHATRVPQRLSGSSSSLGDSAAAAVAALCLSPATEPAAAAAAAAATRRRNRTILSNMPRSRSQSPHVRKGSYGGGGSVGGGASVGSASGSDKGGTAHNDGNSSISSLEELGLDTDILYDRAGIVEDPAELLVIQRNKVQSGPNLTSVNERLSEETLEDVHAFSNLSASAAKTSSSNAGGRVSTGTGGSGGGGSGGQGGAGGAGGLVALAECDQEEEDDDGN